MDTQLIVTVDHVLDALKREPKLVYAGLAVTGHTDVPKGRQGLLKALAEIQMCYDWIAQQDVNKKTVTKGRSSYSFKHAVEECARQAGVNDYYVSNGAFLCAVVIAGVPYKRIEGSLNAIVGIKRHQSNRCLHSARRVRDSGYGEYKPFPEGYTRPVDQVASEENFTELSLK